MRPTTSLLLVALVGCVATAKLINCGELLLLKTEHQHQVNGTAASGNSSSSSNSPIKPSAAAATASTQHQEHTQKVLLGNKQHQQTNDSSGGLVEALSEQLVKQSNLQAEESRPEVAVSILPPPKQHEPPATFTGGSGNSYMSLSRDGSNRYEFGFDTSRAAPAGGHQASPSPSPPSTTPESSSSSSPRLMREESRLEDGTVIGRYGYTDPFNVFRIVQYVAGADGYFAAEDVGAMMESSGGSRPAGKFQLNKQLHKALEQARAQRRRAAERRQQSSPSVGGSAGGAEQQASASVQRPTTTTVASRQEPTEPLSASASHHQPAVVQFSTKINHVIGANGVSYATAFRPVIVNRPQQQQQQLTAAASNAHLATVGQSNQEHHHHYNHHQYPHSGRLVSTTYEPVRSPHPLDAVMQRQQNYEELRSRLPAPIYTPNSFDINFSVDHSATAATTPVALSPQLPSAKVRSLEASPAWSVLNNNYGQLQQPLYQTSLVIDHNDRGAAPIAAGSIGQQIGANFQREASLLKSLRSSGRAGNSFGMAYNYNSTTDNHNHHQNHDQTHLSRHQPTAPSITTNYYAHSAATATRQLHDRSPTWSAQPGRRVEFGARQQQTTSGASNGYNFAGLALRQFDPPLYHPEVHETKPVDLVSSGDSGGSSGQPATVMYSSTVVHSQVAAEHDYKPERLVPLIGAISNSGYYGQPTMGGDEAGEVLLRSSSELQSMAEQQQAQNASAGSGAPSSAGSSSGGAQQPMIIENSTQELGRSTAPTTTERLVSNGDNKTTVESIPLSSDSRDGSNNNNDQSVGGGGDQPVRYATRLSSAAAARSLRPMGAVETEDDMFMDNSEQVAYLSANGTAGGVSRAKMPDRAKKLSSIFKPRSLSSGPATRSDSGGEANSAARLRRPMPANMKKQYQQDWSTTSSSTPTTINTTTPTQSSQAASPATTTASGLEVESSGSVAAEQATRTPTAADEPTKAATKPVGFVTANSSSSSSSGKRFGKGTNGIEKQQLAAEAVESAGLVVGAAKKRPTLREPKRPADTFVEPATVSSSSVSSTSSSIVSVLPTTATTTTDSNPQPEAPIAIVVGQSTSGAPEELLPTATIIDATNHSRGGVDMMKSALDRDLYEKIVRIQQEIAAKTLGSTKTTVPPALEPSSTETPEPTTTNSVLVRAPTAAPPQPTTTTGEQQQQQKKQQLEQPSNKLASLDNSLAAEQAGAKIQTMTTLENDQNFLTGPLVAMDLSMDQNEFLAKLTQDMDSFDSVRSQVLDSPATTTTTTTRAPPTTLNPTKPQMVTSTATSTADFSFYSPTTPVPSQPVAAPAAATTVAPPTTSGATAVNEHRQKEETLEAVGGGRDRGVTSSSRPEDQAASSVTQQSSASVESSGSNSPSMQVSSSPAPIYPTSEIPTPAPSVQAPLNDTHNSSSSSQLGHEHAATSGRDSTALPTPTSTSTRAPSAPAPPVDMASTTERPSSTASGATPVLPTSTTSAPAAVAKSTPPKATRSTAQPARFGRLVIKRGDKVVARFNASEPIPDSMIPIGGNTTEIIMPDMPRLGMRKAIKKMKFAGRKEEAAATTTSSSNTSQGAATAATTVPARVAPAPEVTAAPSATMITESSATTTPEGQLLPGNNNSSRKSLFREPRSYVASASDTIDLMASESRPGTVAETAATDSKRTTTAGATNDADELEVDPATASGRLEGELQKISAAAAAVGLESTTQRPSQRPQRQRLSAITLRPSRAMGSPTRTRDLGQPATASPPSSSASQSALAASSGSRQNVASSTGGRNWSARLRDSIGREQQRQQPPPPPPAPIDKKYDPKEELKKLVDKITDLETRSVAVESRQSASSDSPMPAGGGSSSTSEGGNSQLSSNKRKPKKKNKLGAQPNQEASEFVVGSRNSTSTPLPTTVGVVPSTSSSSLNKQDLPVIENNSNGRLSDKKNQTTTAASLQLGPQQQQQVNSSSIEVVQNRTETLASLPSSQTSVPTNSTSSLSPNSSPSPVSAATIGISPPSTTATAETVAVAAAAAAAAAERGAFSGSRELPLNHSTSNTTSSVSFTVTMSPELKKRHSEDKQTTTSWLTNSSRRAEPERVDSHGHIHVRNNQSVTVHVDIEPPPRQTEQTAEKQTTPLVVATAADQVAAGGGKKRLSTREAAAATGSSAGEGSLAAAFGERKKETDAQRPALVGDASDSVGTRHQRPVSEPISVNNYRSSTLEPSSSSSSSAVVTTTTTTSSLPVVSARARRKPRMLCIEVESDSETRQRAEAVRPIDASIGDDLH